MKKYIFSLLLLSSLALARAQQVDNGTNKGLAKAQKPGARAKRVGIGIKAGLSTLKLDDYKGLKSDAGFVGGIFIALRTSDRFTIQPELLYVRRKEKSNLASVTLNSLSIPLIFNYKLVSFISIEAGPLFDLRLTDDISLSEQYAALEKGIKPKDFKFGAAFGAAINLPFRLQVGARYTFDIVDGLENETGKYLEIFGKHGRFRSWQFTIAYNIP